MTHPLAALIAEKANDARDVFDGTCDTAKQAVDYFEQLILAALEAAPVPDLVEAGKVLERPRLFSNLTSHEAADTIRALIALATAQAAQIAGLEAERDRVAAINVKHCEAVNTLLIDGARLEDRANAAEAKVAELEAQIAGLKADRDAGAKDYCALMEKHDRLHNALAASEAKVSALEGMEMEAHFHIKLWGKAQKELARLRVALKDLTEAFAQKVDVNSHEYRMPYEHPLSAYDRAVEVLASPYEGEKE